MKKPSHGTQRYIFPGGMPGNVIDIFFAVLVSPHGTEFAVVSYFSTV